MNPKIYVALVHHPIINKNGEKVTTSVTNLDIHDIARSSRTFGVSKYFIVTPIEKQHTLINEILGYWNKDFAHIYNPDRADALSFIEIKNTFKDITDELDGPIIAMTGANFKQSDGSMMALQEYSKRENRPILLVFGTGHGLHPEILEQKTYSVDPILGINSDGYNHLSVRSAVAIYLSQLKG